MSGKTYAIASVKDFRRVEERILEDLVKGRLTYFNLVVQDDVGFSSCFFSPATKSKKGPGMIFVGDFGKIVRLLLSHPKVRHIEYDPAEPCISAVFEDPFGEYDRDPAEWEDLEE